MSLAPAILLVSAVLSAEPLADRVERDYVAPALGSILGALDGREPAWTPPVLPGTTQTRRLIEEVHARFMEPLIGSGQGFAQQAARTLASPTAFETPVDPGAAALLPTLDSSTANNLVELIERSFLSRLSREDDARHAAVRETTERIASPSDFAFMKSRRLADSTRLLRGSGGASRPRLKPARSRLSSKP